MDVASLLESPAESLDVELKGWLDLKQNIEHRGLLAKAIVALANHGGGHILIGFLKDGSTDPGRPSILSGYSQDDVNGLIRKYCEPPFHVDVRFVRRKLDDTEYPVISVPGGHGIPIRSCSETPQRSILNHTYYIRRLGPSSESPQDGREWDQLIGRAIRNRKDEIIDQIRDLLGGKAPALPQRAAVLDAQQSWLDEGIRRWKSSLDAHGIAQGEYQWMPLGHWTFSYSLLGDFATPNAVAFKDALRSAYRQLTGWPVFIWLTQGEGQPHLVSSDVIECHIAQPSRFSDAAHADFWVARSDGHLFLRRGYIEDARVVPVEPGTTFDYWLPILRNAEGLLHAQRLAEFLGAGRVQIFVRYTGLKKRRLSVLPGPDRAPVFDFVEKRSSLDTVNLAIEIEASRIQAALPEILRSLLGDLYASFDFTEPPSSEDIDREVKKALRI